MTHQIHQARARLALIVIMSALGALAIAATAYKFDAPATRLEMVAEPTTTTLPPSGSPEFAPRHYATTTTIATPPNSTPTASTAVAGKRVTPSTQPPATEPPSADDMTPPPTPVDCPIEPEWVDYQIESARAICWAFPASAWDAALTVARCESGLRPWATNGSSLGLFQLLGHGDMFLALGYHEADWIDPYANADVASHLSRMGTNWSAWTCKP